MPSVKYLDISQNEVEAEAEQYDVLFFTDRTTGNTRSFIRNFS